MIKNATEIKELKQILSTNGIYEVLKAIQQITQENAETHPKGSVIHRDLINLDKCVLGMRGNQSERMFED